jgi:hypothetical protein
MLDVGFLRSLSKERRPSTSRVHESPFLAVGSCLKCRESLIAPEPEDGPIPPRQARLSRACGPLLLLALAILLSAAAFYTTCSNFESYDDTGFLMLTQKTFFAGHPLYDQTFTQYGPAYYAWQQFVHQVLRVPLSHDSTLLFTAGSWVLISLLCGAYVGRVTRNIFMTALTSFTVFYVLTVLRKSPGHPQELCSLLLAGILLASSFLTGGRAGRTVLGLIGFLIGLLSMTKPNLGAFAALGAWVALGNLAVSKTARRILFGTGALVAVVAPVALMRHNLAEAGTYCLLESGAVLLLVGQLAVASPQRILTWKDLAVPAVGFFAALLLCVAYALASGTSVGGLIQGLVLQHLHFDKAFYVSPKFGWKEVIVSLVLASAVWWATRPGRDGQKALWISAIARCAIAPVMLVLIILMEPAISPAFVWCLPMVAACLFPSLHRSKSPAELLPRQLGVSLAVLNSLGGYPVFGAQGSLSFILLVPIAMVWAMDGLRHGPRPIGKLEPFASDPKAGWALSCMATLGILWLGFPLVGRAGKAYHRLQPSGLRGSQLLRLPGKQADFYRQIIETTRAHGQAFFTMPGVGSLHFWAAKDPPTTWNAGAWMILFDEKQQSKLIQDLENTPDLCVVRLNPAVKFWTHDQDISSNKVVRYIDDHFVIVESFNGCDILVRRSSTRSELQK